MKYLFCVFIFLILSSCSKLTKVVESDPDLGYTVEYYLDKETDLIQGKRSVRTKEGTLVEIATYKNGELNGLREIYNEAGELEAKELYNMGILDGHYKAFYENGELELEGLYVNNKMAEVWIRYYEDGSILEEVKFIDNEENGPFIEYYPNGNIKAKGTYANGDFEEGELRLYTEDGSLDKIMDCVSGRCVTRK